LTPHFSEASYKSFRRSSSSAVKVCLFIVFSLLLRTT
jgi:hypothetical protein